MRPYAPRMRRGLDVVPRGNFAARWLHELRPISHQPVEVGLPHRAGWYQPGGSPFSSRFVGVVEIWKEFVSGDETLSSPGAAGLQRCPVGKLPPCAGSMNPSQSATSQSASHPVWLRFPYPAGRYGLGDLRFRPQVVRVVKIWKDF